MSEGDYPHLDALHRSFREHQRELREREQTEIEGTSFTGEEIQLEIERRVDEHNEERLEDEQSQVELREGLRQEIMRGIGGSMTRRDTERLTELAQAAERSTSAVSDVGNAFERLTEGINSATEAMGRAVFDTEIVQGSVRWFARALGINWDEMPEEQRQQALLNMTLQRAEERQNSPRPRMAIDTVNDVRNTMDDSEMREVAESLIRDVDSREDLNSSAVHAYEAGFRDAGEGMRQLRGAGAYVREIGHPTGTVRFQTSDDGVTWRDLPVESDTGISLGNAIEEVEMTTFSDTQRQYVAGIGTPRTNVDVSAFADTLRRHITEMPSEEIEITGSFTNEAGRINGVPVYVDASIPEGEVRMSSDTNPQVAYVNPASLERLRSAYGDTIGGDVSGDAEVTWNGVTNQWGFEMTLRSPKKPQDGLVRKIRR